jgi:Clp amino terminal domain, pathogenicity island component
LNSKTEEPGMFEKYTEDARRVIFFARYEASGFGSPTIESEHLLLGLLRERKDLLYRFLDRNTSATEIRTAITRSTPLREPTATSIDLPLSDECKRILAFSAEESERLAHSLIGSEHLLLGTLREQNCFAARLLRERGLQVDQLRPLIAAEPQPASGLDSGTRAFRHTPATEIHIVEAGSAEPLLTYSRSPLIPRPGDTILIRDEASDEAGDEGRPDRSFQVQAVVWEFIQESGRDSSQDAALKHVTVTVAPHSSPDDATRNIPE